MNGITDKIANLTQEQRNLLIQKLKQKSAGGSIQTNIENKQTEFGADENFCCEMLAPGNFRSIKFRGTEKIKPGIGQILIEAKAASLNFRDLMIAMNMYPPSPGVPSIMGSDYAGLVVEVGEGVCDFQTGDRVYALSAGNIMNDGSIEPNSHFSRYVCVSEYQAAKFPNILSFEQAASLPTVFLTSYYALVKSAALQKSEKVLIHTATGGVGLSAVQIAKHIGAEIFATAGSEEKREYLRSIGIKNPMNSRTSEYADEIFALTEGVGIDVVLNTLPGENGAKGIEILDYFGRFLQIDKSDTSQNAILDIGLLKKGITYSVIDLSLFLMRPAKLKKMLNEISEHFANGDYMPIKTTVYPYFELAEALTYMSRSKYIGKIALKF